MNPNDPSLAKFMTTTPGVGANTSSSSASLAEAVAESLGTAPVSDSGHKPTGEKSSREAAIEEAVSATLSSMGSVLPGGKNGEPSSLEEAVRDIPVREKRRALYESGKPVSKGDIVRSPVGYISVVEGRQGGWIKLDTPGLGAMLVTESYMKACSLIRRKAL